MNDMSKIVTDWRPWLPESALARGGVDQALADVARQWSAKWLARKSVRPLGVLATAGLSLADSARCLVLDDDVALVMSSVAADRLAMLILGEPAPPASLDAADRRVLDTLIDAAVQDLCRRIAEALGFSPETRWRDLGRDDVPSIERPLVCQMGVDAATPLLHFAVATDVLIARARARAGRSPVRDRVKPIAAGLVVQQVDISASLGRCSLTLADLAGLGVGDVLVFDRTAEAPLALSLNGVPARRGACSVQRDGDRLELRLLEPLAS
jgi:hypothetical protein